MCDVACCGCETWSVMPGKRERGVQGVAVPVTGLGDVEDPTSAPRWWQDWQPYAPAALYSPETLFFLFMVLIHTAICEPIV
jgi:hypothetical protein